MPSDLLDITAPLDEITFYCTPCKRQFTCEPAQVEDAPEKNHPYIYYSNCPDCDMNTAQIPWEKGVMQALGKQTGPKTEAGKKSSAKNLSGHPTPEAMQTIRFNAMKHGLSAKVADFFPAKPGGYPRCTNCEHLSDRSCVPYRGCLKHAELFLKNDLAFKANDPQLLMSIRADTQAALQAMVNDIILTIALDGGVRLKTPEWYSDKDGGCHLARFEDEMTGEQVQIYKLEAHPLLKPLLDIISKNNMSLGDMGMTPKVQDQNEITQGFLDRETEKETITDYQQRISDQQDILRDLIQGTPDEQVVEGEIIP